MRLSPSSKAKTAIRQNVKTVQTQLSPAQLSHPIPARRPNGGFTSPLVCEGPTRKGEMRRSVNRWPWKPQLSNSIEGGLELAAAVCNTQHHHPLMEIKWLSRLHLAESEYQEIAAIDEAIVFSVTGNLAERAGESNARESLEGNESQARQGLKLNFVNAWEGQGRDYLPYIFLSAARRVAYAEKALVAGACRGFQGGECLSIPHFSVF
ncbi:hypothetical protein FHL15_000505 [Xylaria flabelliformis]|uniref:Uncharacterized protein n=1 Tax=Xylaria flabelliformis TaxID=2512241 RepID=A0A553IE11_9PEZI|nr:hypothetical protein FHL15_000505 [Xylaria flabelliformis]